MDLMKKQGIILIVMIVFAGSLICFGQEPGSEETTEETKQASFTSLHKSLLWPGWGQLAEKRYVEGILFSAAEVFCVGEIIINNHKGNQEYKLYKNADNVQDAVKYRRSTEKYDTRRNQFILAAAGIWAVNLIDMYFIFKGKKSREKKLTAMIKTSSGDQISLIISYSF